MANRDKEVREVEGMGRRQAGPYRVMGGSSEEAGSTLRCCRRKRLAYLKRHKGQEEGESPGAQDRRCTDRYPSNWSLEPQLLNLKRFLSQSVCSFL